MVYWQATALILVAIGCFSSLTKSFKTASEKYPESTNTYMFGAVTGIFLFALVFFKAGTFSLIF